MGGYAWVTLATNDAYSLGALVLAHSLRRVGTKYELAVLITPGVTQTMREKLAAVFSLVQEVNVLDSKDAANLALLARPELGITFTKLHCWRLTQYDKCVFVDADTLVVRNCDELFEREELSAAPDVGWPDCFNSGVFVFKPSEETFAAITAFASAKGSFDGGDQGLLNMYFNDWAWKDISKHLPFIYNMCSTATYSYLPAYKQFGEDVRIIHFIGITKPWLQYFDTLTGIVQPPANSAHLQPLLQLWWNIFCDNVHPQLSPLMAGLAGALAQMTLGEPRTAEQIALEEHMRKQSWEQGQIDYMGRDSFDNIWKKICETLSLAPEQEASPAKDVVQPEASTTDPDSPPSDIKSEIPIAEVASDLREEFLTCNIPTETTEEKEREKNAGLTDPLMQHELLNFCNTSSADVCTPQLSAEGSIIQSLTSTDIGQMLKTSDVDNKQVYTQASASGSLTLGTSKDVILKDSAHTLLEQVGSQDTTLKAPSDSIIPISTKKLEEHLSGVVSGVSLDLTNPPPSTPANNKSEKSISLDTTIDIVAKSESNMSHPSYGDQHILTGQEGGNVLMQGDNQVQTKNTDISNKSDSSTTSCTMSKSIPISPVPIQVAESVLQTEPRESVSEEPKLISEEVISSVDRPVCESAAALSETLIEPTRKTQLSEIPFGTSHEKTGNGICIPEVTSGIVASPSANLDLIDSRKAETAITQASETLKVRETNLDAQPDVCPRVTEDTSKLLCTKENLTKLTGTVQELQGTAPNKQEEAIALDTAQSVSECDTELTKFPKQQETKIPASESVVSPKLEVSSIMSPDPTLDEIPIRPTRTKESSTPPAPPAETTSSPPEAATSDSQNPGKTLKKSGKKVVKKSMSECESTDGADGEGTEKKTVKKVVKKIVKKPKESQDDGAESSSAIEKPKKTTKVIKKTTKPQNSGPQLSETSPPDNSNTPVPPKRKVKAPAPTKVSIAKKPDAEP